MQCLNLKSFVRAKALTLPCQTSKSYVHVLLNEGEVATPSSCEKVEGLGHSVAIRPAIEKPKALARSLKTRSLAACLTISLVAANPTSYAASLDRDTLKAQIKELWDSFDSFTLSCEMIRLNANSLPDPGRGHLRYEMARETGGRWAMTFSSLKSGKPEVFECFREDGRRRYNIHYIRGNPDWMSRIEIQSQASNSDHYIGMMSCIAWLLMPGGKPVVSHLTADADVEEKIVAGRKVVILVTEHKGQPLRCVLDPEHDWLPQRIELGKVDGEAWSRWEVTRFGRDNGRWLPAEGREAMKSQGQEQMWSFSLTDFSINEPVDPGRFSMPVPTEGVVVRDETTKQRVVKGGPRAQEKLVQEYRKSKETPPPGGVTKPPSPIVASREPLRPPWAVILVCSSAGVLLIAAAIRLGLHRLSRD